ncbi:MAG: hypothetical protein QNJ65_05160 [Xenococcaceae cyanobacterium MO_234.B1]|nr:hypothetical protein [Xenococcaceae cyanobacterium MO_234.B1]
MNTNDDRNYLKILSVFYYIIGGFFAFLALIFGYFFIRKILIIISPESFPIESAKISAIPDYKSYMYISTIISGIYFILGESFAIAIIMSGRFLKVHKKYWFSFIIACILCLIMPVGTLLGILTIIVLSRESVKQLYFSSN